MKSFKVFGRSEIQVDFLAIAMITLITIHVVGGVGE